MCRGNFPYRGSRRIYPSDDRTVSGDACRSRTVLTREQVDAAVAAGAKFIVSPGFDPEIVDTVWKKKFLFFQAASHRLRSHRQ